MLAEIYLVLIKWKTYWIFVGILEARFLKRKNF